MTNRFRMEMNARLREMDWHGEDGVFCRIHRAAYMARIGMAAALSCLSWLGNRFRDSLKEWNSHGK